MTGASRSWLALAAALALTGCARAPRPAAAPVVVEAPTLEQLYLSKRYGELVLQATAILDAGAGDRERVAEARFYRAIAWLAQDPHGKQARALHDLRKLEFESSDLLWGRIAALYVAAVTRADVLQTTLLELAIEQRDLQTRVEALEHGLAELHAELAERDADLAGLTRERNELVEQLDEAREQAATLVERIRELEAELAALKQIDMQREP